MFVDASTLLPYSGRVSAASDLSMEYLEPQTNMIMLPTKPEAASLSELAQDKYPDYWNDHRLGRTVINLCEDWKLSFNKHFLLSIWAAHAISRNNARIKGTDIAMGASATYSLEQTDNLFLTGATALGANAFMTIAGAAAVSTAINHSPNIIKGSKQNFKIWSWINSNSHPYIDYNTESETRKRKDWPKSKRASEFVKAHTSRGLVGMSRISSSLITAAREGQSEKEISDLKKSMIRASLFFKVPAIFGGVILLDSVIDNNESVDIAKITYENPVTWSLVAIGGVISAAKLAKETTKVIKKSVFGTKEVESFPQ